MSIQQYLRLPSIFQAGLRTMCGWSRRRTSEGCTLWRSRSACSLPVSACPSLHAAWSRVGEPPGSRFAPERRSFSSPPGFAHLPLSFDYSFARPSGRKVRNDCYAARLESSSRLAALVTFPVKKKSSLHRERERPRWWPPQPLCPRHPTALVDRQILSPSVLTQRWLALYSVRPAWK